MKIRVKHSLLSALAMAMVVVSVMQSLPSAHAQSQPRAESRSDSDDEYNFSWLDPDKKVYVLQNRKYRKARKVAISLFGGAAFGETYRQVYAVQPRIGTWFNEDFGVEAFFSQRFHSVNNAYRSLNAAVGTGTSPLIREIKSQFGILFNWAPWYAKINVFNTVLYFDWIFSLGLGSMQTEFGEKTKAELPTTWREQNLFAVYAGTGQIFHLTEVVDIRLDVLGHFYSADVFGATAATPLSSSIFSGLTTSLGIGVKL